jgi:3-isopropylmalate/(R)-2-methylmalate dehydratase small subunit
MSAPAAGSVAVRDGLPPGGRAWKFGDNLDTDVLAPGLYMKFGIAEIATHCLESVRPEFAAQVKPGDVVVGGRNFGVGSSREQAPQALKHLGVAAVIAESYSGLFYRNALNLGLAVVVCREAQQIADGDRVLVDPENGVITLAGAPQRLACEPIPAFLMAMLRDGGLLPHLEKRLKEKQP